MRRIMITLLSALALVSMQLSPALAASPHFKKGGTPTCRDTGTALQCSGALAGLGNEDVDIVLEADALGTFRCVNPSAKNEPLGQNKVPFSATADQHFDSSELKNGSLSFTISAPETPPTATPQQAGCPGGNWSTRLVAVDFSNIELTISQGGVLLFTCTRSGAVPTNGTSVTLSCTAA